MNKKAKAALIVSACSGFLFNVSPIYASEVNYKLTYNDEKSLVRVLDKEFKQDLTDLGIVEIEGDKIVLESDDYKVVVDALDLNKDEIQSVKASLYEKTVNEVLGNLGFPEYEADTTNVNVEVVDKTAPVIEAKDTIETTLHNLVDWPSYVKATDERDGLVTYKIDGDVDYNKDGTYKVTIKASDKSGNEASKEVTVKVKDEKFYQRIADAALAQVGANQDCTMLVTNALAAVGINFHGAPEEYASLGNWTNNPVPGDICIYSGHVALYIGNGRAVHGGWLGYTTVVSTVECTNAFIGYIHVNH